MAKKKKKKKSSASRSRRERGSSERTTSTPGEVRGVDLAEFLLQEGVNPARIPDVLAFIRVHSDTQSGEGIPPPVPVPPVDSAEELNRATAADAMILESDNTATQARIATAGNAPTALQGCQDLFWAMETGFVRDDPRASFVGRAIHERSGENHRPNSTDVYNTIYTADERLLPPRIRNAVETQRLRLEEGRTTRTQNNDASSKVTKHIKPRIALLASRLGYVEARKRGKESRYRLVGRGQQVFDGWPAWDAPDAIRGGGDGEADVGEAPSGD